MVVAVGMRRGQYSGGAAGGLGLGTESAYRG